MIHTSPKPTRLVLPLFVSSFLHCINQSSFCSARDSARVTAGFWRFRLPYCRGRSMISSVILASSTSWTALAPWCIRYRIGAKGQNRTVNHGWLFQNHDRILILAKNKRRLECSLWSNVGVTSVTTLLRLLPQRSFLRAWLSTAPSPSFRSHPPLPIIQTYANLQATDADPGRSLN